MADLSDDNRMNLPSVDVWNCANAFEFVCPKYWDSLAETSDSGIRHCAVCNQQVYRCSTPLEFVTHAELGHCVAVPDNRTPSHGFEKHMLGRPTKADYDDLKLRRTETLRWWQDIIDMHPRFAPTALAEVARMLRLRPLPATNTEEGGTGR